tara:strand:- start:970 stop:1377 length:408 start_codon:yes stop_codon:yes gene_type:complete
MSLHNNKKMSVFSTTTKQLLWVADGDASNPVNNIDEGRATFDGAYTSKDRLNDSLTEVVSKEDIPYIFNKLSITADGEDYFSLSFLPEGTVLTVLGETEEEYGGSITFTADLVGNYILELSHPLYLPVTIEVPAV